MAATTRRTLLEGAAAAAPAPIATQAKPPNDPDAILVALEAEFASADKHLAQADTLEIEAYNRFKAIVPPVPEAMKRKPIDWACGLGSERVHTDEVRVREIRDRNAELFAQVGCNRSFVERCDEILADIPVHRAAVERADRASGSSAARQVTEAMERERDRVLTALRDTPAQTLKGLAIKTRVAALFIDEAEELTPFGTRWAQAILNDIRAMENV